MWSSLPSNLRTTLGVSLALGAGVAAAAFALSFFALRAAASNPELQFGQGHAWLFPIALDMTLLFFEVGLITASMVRIYDARTGRVKQYPRAVPFLLVAAAGASTLYFNATRVPDRNWLRMIALAVPVASLLVTFGLAYLLKMLAALTGAEVGVIQADSAYSPTGALEVFRRNGPSRETGSSGRSGNGHNGQRMLMAPSKREAVEAFLSGCSHEQIEAITGGELATLVKDESGVEVTDRYARTVLDAWKAKMSQPFARRRLGRR
jgi:hypothetical protein